MTALLEEAFAMARELDPKVQDRVARIVMAAVDTDERPVYQLTPEEEESLAPSRAQARRGEFVPDEEMEALFDEFET